MLLCLYQACLRCTRLLEVQGFTQMVPTLHLMSFLQSFACVLYLRRTLKEEVSQSHEGKHSFLS